MEKDNKPDKKPERTFQELRLNLATLLGNEHKTLRRVFLKLKEIKDSVDIQVFNYFALELETINGQKHNIEETVDKLYHKAIFDSVTGLHTRTYLDDVMLRGFTEPFVYIMGDIDWFKPYNDIYGHQQGDLALNLISGKFEEGIRETLQDGEKPLIARYGGEEVCAFIGAFKGNRDNLKKRGKLICNYVKELDIPLHEMSASKKSGYKKKTITLAGAISFVKEHPKALRERVDQVLINAKNRNERGKIHLA